MLTARDETRGKAAVQQLQAEGLSPRFHQLDIDDLQSIRALRDFLLKEYGGLDVLVNNAGIAFKSKPWVEERGGYFPGGARMGSSFQGSIARAGKVSWESKTGPLGDKEQGGGCRQSRALCLPN